MSRCDRCADAPFVSNRPRRRPSSPERASLRRFEESASPQINRRGSRARVTPVVRARVDARTTRSRKRAAVCSSEGLAHEASIPEMLCGSPRSLPRARASGMPLLGTRSAFAEWSSFGRSGCRSSSFDRLRAHLDQLYYPLQAGSDEFQFSLRPSKSTGRGTEPHTRAEKKTSRAKRKIAVALSEEMYVSVSELLSRSRRHETRGAGIGGVDRRSRSCGATGVGSGALTSVAGVATDSGARSPADCEGEQNHAFSCFGIA